LIGLLPFPLDLRGHLRRLGEDFVDVHQLVELLVTEHMKLGDDDIQQERDREKELPGQYKITVPWSSSATCSPPQHTVHLNRL
jgi:hypothetical protein